MWRINYTSRNIKLDLCPFGPNCITQTHALSHRSFLGQFAHFTLTFIHFIYFFHFDAILLHISWAKQKSTRDNTTQTKAKQIKYKHRKKSRKKKQNRSFALKQTNSVGSARLIRTETNMKFIQVNAVRSDCQRIIVSLSSLHIFYV